MESKTSKIINSRNKKSRVLLKNGLIVDGTGKRPWKGSLLINGDKIEAVTGKDINIKCETINCAGKVIAPGFIDMHSHNDWLLSLKGNEEQKTPFTMQGITTFVAGNCGFSAAGFKKDSGYMHEIVEIADLFKGSKDGIYWKSMEEYFRYLEKNKLSHNLVNLAGHGTTRTTIKGYDPAPLAQGEMGELLYLLEEAMDQGAPGVSLGLGYRPGIFATCDELTGIAQLVKKKDKILTVHLKALSALSGAYPVNPLGKPHNIIALEEVIELARHTGVKLQISHLIFVGTRAWNTYSRALSLIDKAIAQGINVKFDIYPFTCGASILYILMPPWVLARVPKIFDNRAAVVAIKAEFILMKKLLGFGFEDIQIAHATHPDLDRFNGMFLSDIAKERKISQTENLVDFVKKSGGNARVLMHRYSNPEIILELMRHPASLFMTDAWITASIGAKNPAAYGSFPRFLQLARETGALTLEAAVRKMTGASAERFNIKDRGVLRKGLAADITVFDWNTVRDNTTNTKTDAPPGGIEEVFINGRHAVKKGKADRSVKAGNVIAI